MPPRRAGSKSFGSRSKKSFSSRRATSGGFKGSKKQTRGGLPSKASSESEEEQEDDRNRIGIGDVRFGEIGSEEEDEEIDSDEAGGSEFSEEENKSKGKGKGKAKVVEKAKGQNKSLKKRRASSSEDEEEQDEQDDDEEFMDATAVLDSNMFPLSSESDSESKSQGMDPSESEEEESDFSVPSGDEDLALPKLQSFIDSIPVKRGAEGEGEGERERGKKRRRILEEKGEAWAEGDGEWVAVSNRGDKVTLEDMLSTLPTSQNTKDLQKSLKPLVPKSSDPNSRRSKKHNPLMAAGPLSVPLPLLHQNRLERKAASELTRKEVDKWDPISKVMRGHGEINGLSSRLMLPLPENGGGGESVKGKTGGDLSSKFVSKGGMEAELEALLSLGGMEMKTLQEKEMEVAKEDVTKEEEAMRVGALRLERDLLFRAERKAKRIAKIKSKTFRKIRRKAQQGKEKEEGNLDLETLRQLDALDGGNRVQDEMEKLERERAKERVTLRHGGGGKWATKMKGLELEGLDRDDRDALMRDKADLAAKLRQKMQGPDESSDEDDEDEETPDDETLEMYRKELEELKAREDVPKGTYGLKFMINAKAKKEQEKEKELEKLRRELNGEASDEESVDGVGKVHGNLGRLIFGIESDLVPTPLSNTMGQAEADEADEVELHERPAIISSSRPMAKSTAQEIQSNPWLITASSEPLLKPKRASDNAAQDKIEKHKSKGKAARRKEAEDANVELDLESYLGKETHKGTHKVQKSSKEDESEPEIEEDGRGRIMFNQRELVAEAFEGDDVVAAFEAEKQMEIAKDAPRTEDITLPGWGSWAGKGIKKRKTDKKFLKQIPGLDPSKRADFNLGHVIISEKKDKRAAEKYLVKDLPWPYTSEHQFRKAMEVKIGKEWNTASRMREMTRDGGEKGVVVKRGATVRPLEATI